jgi:hypothetical protein
MEVLPTCFVKHFIALIEDEHLQVVEIQCFVLHQLQDATWGADHDVRRVRSLQYLYILLHRDSSKEDFLSDFGKVFGKTITLVFNLMCQLSRVAKNEHGAGLRILVQLMKHGKNEDSCFSST